MTETLRKRVGSSDAFVELGAAVGETLAAIRRTSRRAVRERLNEDPLPMAEVEVLVAVADTPGIRVADTARLLGLASNTVSTLVTRLVDAGLIERRVDPSDRRVAALHLTKAGRVRLKAWRTERARMMAEALAELSPADVERITASIEPLRHLSDTLHERAERAER